MLAQAEKAHATQYVEPLLVLGLCQALGDKPALRRWMERARSDHSTMVLYARLVGYLYNDDPEVKAFFSQR
jgi:hypothetical protein